jgi:hypothetical protein
LWQPCFGRPSSPIISRAVNLQDYGHPYICSSVPYSLVHVEKIPRMSSFKFYLESNHEGEEDNPYNAGGQLVLDSGLYQHPSYGICNQRKYILVNFYPLKWWAILVNYADVCSFLLQRSLATDLQNLSMELRKKQSTYLKRLRQQKEVLNKFSFSTIQWAHIFRLEFAIYKLHNSSHHLL